MKILVVEDEPEMMDNIVAALKSEQYLVETAGTYDDALLKVHSYEYDCILLDIGLNARLNGLDILKELKDLGKTEGVIIVSAKNSLDDKLTGLHLGADDYLPKPFHIAELIARVQSVIRRRKFTGSNIIRVSNLSIDPAQRTVFIGTEPFATNRKEFDILLYLAINQNRLVNKSALAEYVWGDHIDNADNFDFIYSQIKNLRKKLRESNAGLDIQSVYGLGYKLCQNETA